MNSNIRAGNRGLFGRRAAGWRLNFAKSGLALMLVFAGMRPAGAEGACEIVIGSCHRPPLSAPDGQGAVDRVVIEAFRRVGRAACIDALPCERSLLNADQGITDGDLLRVPAAIEKRYPNLLAVPEIVYRLSMHAFALRPEIRVSRLEDLEPLRVGYILGWKILEDKVRAREILHVRGPELLFPLLEQDRADVVIYERLTGLKMLEELGLKQIRLLEPPLLVLPQYLVVNVRHRALVEPLVEAMRAMKADGSYAAAFRRAGVEPLDLR